MAEPRVPGADESDLGLACGETVDYHTLDMGLRELSCSCGDRHAVVQDVHPLSRFVPEDLVAVLNDVVETTDGSPFSTLHLMGIVREEFPESIVSESVGEDGTVGYSMVWVAQFDARRLHEIVVELIVELMEHAISHTEDSEAMRAFERQMHEFDVSDFVDQYRDAREFTDEHDRPA